MGQNRRRYGRYLYAVPCFAILWTLMVVVLRNQRENDPIRRSVRLPLAQDPGVDCIPSGADAFPGDFMTEEQRRRGGIVVHLLIVCYACAMTAVVCDDFFVPALEAITGKLNLSPDVAGATFMAMGASAPELFSSIAGSFVTEDDIGLGTILGSAVFNILGISGIVGLVLWNRPVPIEWYPVVRDCIVYGLTVLVLSFIILDNIVRWWEALILLLIFGSYIFLMNFNSQIEKAAKDFAKFLQGCKSGGKQVDSEKDPLLKEEKIVVQAENKDVLQKADPEAGGEEEEEEEEGSCCCMPVWKVLMWPPSLLFRLTIPPVRWYPATFIMSIVWMGALSYVAVWMVTIIASTLSIPDSVAGLTLLAAGSSVPDLIATVVVARSGKGNMAISNLLGSNTFDLAFCLGAPWFVKTLTSGKGRLLVYSSAMVYTVSTLLVTLVALLLTFHFTRWRLNRASGLVCLSLYVTSITLACLYELNVFGEVNKPVCS